MARWLIDYRHMILAALWATLTIPAWIWWRDSVFYVIIVSHYANLVSELAAHHALRAHQQTNETS